MGTREQDHKDDRSHGWPSLPGDSRGVRSLSSRIQPWFLSYRAGNPFTEDSVIPEEIPAGSWPLRTVRTGSGHLLQEHSSGWRKDKPRCHKAKMFGESFKEHNNVGCELLYRLTGTYTHAVVTLVCVTPFRFTLLSPSARWPVISSSWPL